ncbi:MAG: NnrU family protein [Rhodospirillales bacterium]|jgi:uncharacterized membrane protein|nr:NnrU family protein [Rhodospirillales bacterium]HJO72278.1 NnrU family protein [Rhodospirillales bacterium]
MTGTFAELFLAGFVFVGSHVVVSSTALRPALVRVVGERPFLVLYSLLSIALLVWMVRTHGAAPYVEYWALGTGHRHLAMGIMFVACMLVAAGLSPSSPTGVLAAETAPRPAGIFKITRHPVMWGVGLWGFAHMAANGDAASFLFFGWLAGLALLGTVFIERKKKAALGADWEAFAAASSNVPFAAVLAGRARLGLGEIGYWRLAVGMALYLILFFAHEYVIGVSPLAP